MFLGHGTNVDSAPMLQTKFGGPCCTVLYIASREGNLKILLQLLDLFANVNTQNSHGWIAMHAAG